MLVYLTYVVLLFPSSTPICSPLQSDATPRPVRRKLMIPAVSPVPRPLPARDPHARLRFLRKFFSSSFRTDAVRTDEPRNPLDVCFFHQFAS
jgi:hypothetical protein